MSALVRFQGKVIWIQTSYGEPYPTEVQDGEESLLEMGHKEESLNGTTENGEYSSDVRQYRACWRVGEAPAKQDADLWLYRDRTVMLLKHYARMAVESGRLPSLLGRECFGTRVTPYAMASFEDMAIFVHDMQTSLSKLNPMQQQLIRLNVLEEFSQVEIARLLGCTTRWIGWQVSDALDALTGVLVRSGLVRERCQEGRKNESAVSRSIERKNIS